MQSGSISAGLGGATSALTKTTSGLVTLNAANSYAGGTTIAAGTLALGASGTLGSGNVAINPGAVLDVLSLFGGSGYNFNSGVLTAGRTGPSATDVNGNLNVNAAALAQSVPNSTMTIGGNLSLNAATLSYNVGDQVAIGGGLTIASTDFVAPTSFLSAGMYTLFTYSASGGLTGSATDFVGSGPFGSSARQAYTFGTSGGTAVTLSVTGQAGNLEWRGGTWNTNGSLSWYNLSTSAADTFYAGDLVTFDDTAGTANGNVVISGTSGSVLPGSVTVSNTAVNYTFSGVPIAGTTSLTKSGPGNLTLSSSNAYSGGTSLHGGVLNANAGSALGTGALTVNGGTLNVNAAQPLSSVSISGGAINAAAVGALGAGPLAQSGGVLTAGAAQSISSVALSGGQLNIGDPNALGSGTLTISGGTLANTSGSTIVLGGNNAQNWNGSFSVTGTSALNLGAGPVTLGVSPTITLGGTTLTVGGPISDSGAGLGLSLDGSGLLVLNGSNTFSGNTTLNGGTLAAAWRLARFTTARLARPSLVLATIWASECRGNIGGGSLGWRPGLPVPNYPRPRTYSFRNRKLWESKLRQQPVGDQRRLHRLQWNHELSRRKSRWPRFHHRGLGCDPRCSDALVTDLVYQSRQPRRRHFRNIQHQWRLAYADRRGQRRDRQGHSRHGRSDGDRARRMDAGCREHLRRRHDGQRRHAAIGRRQRLGNWRLDRQ